MADDDAFRGALGVDVAAFEAGWLADLEADEPVPYGPKPAPPGPLPPGWNAAPQPSGRPLATPPPSRVGNGGDDVATTLVIGAVALFGIVVVLGIIIVARGLNRGDPLLPSGGGSATLTGAGGPQPDPELPPDLAGRGGSRTDLGRGAWRGGPRRGGAWHPDARDDR